jgi:hypothetical protein
MLARVWVEARRCAFRWGGRLARAAGDGLVADREPAPPPYGSTAGTGRDAGA